MDPDDFLVENFIDEFPIDIGNEAANGDFSDVMDSVVSDVAANTGGVHYLIQMPNGGNLLPSVFTVRKCFKSFI
jgi:hypothetical protein